MKSTFILISKRSRRREICSSVKCATLRKLITAGLRYNSYMVGQQQQRYTDGRKEGLVSEQLLLRIALTSGAVEYNKMNEMR